MFSPQETKTTPKTPATTKRPGSDRIVTLSQLLDSQLDEKESKIKAEAKFDVIPENYTVIAMTERKPETVLVSQGNPQKVKPEPMSREQYCKMRGISDCIEVLLVRKNDEALLKKLMAELYKNLTQGTPWERGREVPSMTSAKYMEKAQQTSDQFLLADYGKGVGFGVFTHEKADLQLSAVLSLSGVFRIVKHEDFKRAKQISGQVSEKEDFINLVAENILGYTILLDGFEYRGMYSHFLHGHSRTALKNKYSLKSDILQQVAEPTFAVYQTNGMVWLTDKGCFAPSKRSNGLSKPLQPQLHDYGDNYFNSRPGISLIDINGNLMTAKLTSTVLLNIFKTKDDAGSKEILMEAEWCNLIDTALEYSGTDFLMLKNKEASMLCVISKSTVKTILQNAGESTIEVVLGQNDVCVSYLQIKALGYWAFLHCGEEYQNLVKDKLKPGLNVEDLWEIDINFTDLNSELMHFKYLLTETEKNKIEKSIKGLKFGVMLQFKKLENSPESSPMYRMYINANMGLFLAKQLPPPSKAIEKDKKKSSTPNPSSNEERTPLLRHSLLSVTEQSDKRPTVTGFAQESKEAPKPDQGCCVTM